MILIDIKMPGCCMVCPMCDDSGDYITCIVNGKSMGYMFDPFLKRMPTCPLRKRKNEKNSVHM